MGHAARTRSHYHRTRSIAAMVATIGLVATSTWACGDVSGRGTARHAATAEDLSVADALAMPVDELLELAPEPPPDAPVLQGPVYVADADVAEDGRVSFDMVVAFRPLADLRGAPFSFDAVARTARRAGVDVEVDVTRDGDTAELYEDAARAELVVQLDPPLVAAEALRLRLRGTYVVPDTDAVAQAAAETGMQPPMIFQHGGAAVLGTWLPTLQLAADGSYPPPSDRSGRVPPGSWFLTLRAGDRIVLTGGEDEPCTGATCTFVRADHLTTLDAVLLTDATTVSRPAGDLDLRITVPAAGRELGEDLADVAAALSGWYGEALGELPWRQVDVVPATMVMQEMSGLSFPGLVVVEPDAFEDPTSTTARRLVAHELSHQWFGALVENDTADGTVVHESAATYLSYVDAARHAGQAAADRLVRDIDTWWRETAEAGDALDQPPVDPRPGLPAEVSWALSYGRAALGWVEADRQVGTEVVMNVLRAVVDQHRMGYIDAPAVISIADAVSPTVGATLHRYWLDPVDPGPARR